MQHLIYLKMIFEIQNFNLDKPYHRHLEDMNYELYSKLKKSKVLASSNRIFPPRFYNKAIFIRLFYALFEANY